MGHKNKIRTTIREVCDCNMKPQCAYKAASEKGYKLYRVSSDRRVVSIQTIISLIYSNLKYSLTCYKTTLQHKYNSKISNYNILSPPIRNLPFALALPFRNRSSAFRILHIIPQSAFRLPHSIPRYRSDQLFGVLFLRVIINFIRIAHFNDPAFVHHHHPV